MTSRVPATDYDSYRAAFEGRPMPFAYVDLDALDINAAQVADYARGKRVRLASKSIRSVAILRRILGMHSCFRGIMCTTASEAVYLARQGFTDLLVGYPVCRAGDVEALAEALAAGAQITLMVDCAEHVDRIERVAGPRAVRVPVCLDVDMASDMPGLRFGVWRSPICDASQARPVIDRILSSSHVTLDGIMGYEAQIAGVGDSHPRERLKNGVVRWLKRRSVREVTARRRELVELAASYNVALRFVNGGGTGSLETTAADPAVTEVTIGSAFYAPALFDHYRDFRYAPAAGFAIEIVRRPAPGIYTCAGGGYVGSGAAGEDKLPQPHLPPGARLLAHEGAGEVQTPIRYSGPVKLELGGPIFMRHAKAGELCERFPKLLLVSKGQVVDEATTYRGDGQCFL